MIGFLKLGDSHTTSGVLGSQSCMAIAKLDEVREAVAKENSILSRQAQMASRLFLFSFLFIYLFILGTWLRIKVSPGAQYNYLYNTRKRWNERINDLIYISTGRRSISLIQPIPVHNGWSDFRVVKSPKPES